MQLYFWGVVICLMNSVYEYAVRLRDADGGLSGTPAAGAGGLGAFAYVWGLSGSVFLFVGIVVRDGLASAVYVRKWRVAANEPLCALGLGWVPGGVLVDAPVRELRQGHGRRLRAHVGQRQVDPAGVLEQAAQVLLRSIAVRARQGMAPPRSSGAREGVPP
eukprot:scaffold350_cov313-Prasinococcus_capsulatus_cf.AAC.4